jgi:peptide/nickel transport system permease protein
MQMMQQHIDAAAVRVEHPILEAWRMFKKNTAALAGLVILILIILLAIIGPKIYPVNPFQIVSAPLLPPASGGPPLGTDYLGRDILSGLVHGSRATLVVGVSAALCTLLIGIIIGALAGFYGGWVENILMRLTEVFQVLPSLLLAMVLVTLFSPSLEMITLAIGVSTWTGTARLTRGEFLKIRGQDYVMSARSVGALNRYIIWRVIFPNTLPPLIVMAALNVGVAILFEAMLSFLGLGDPNIMSWGMMIGLSRDYIFVSWWAVTFPGLAIFLAVLSISLIGDGLNDAFNPKLRER